MVIGHQMLASFLLSFFLVVLWPHAAMLKGYSQLCTWESTPSVLREPCGTRPEFLHQHLYPSPGAIFSALSLPVLVQQAGNANDDDGATSLPTSHTVHLKQLSHANFLESFLVHGLSCH